MYGFARHLSVGIYIIVVVAISMANSRADDLSDLLVFWQSQAFECKAGQLSFPSKYAADDPNNCDDGDMTLFNGLLCASSDRRGCDGVKRAQANDGRWWRSPRRIGWEAPNHDVSFSPDQALGVLHYVMQDHDKASFDRWYSWIDSHRPCLAEAFGRCVLKGWPRFCTDDQQDKRCTFRPGDCALIAFVGEQLGRSSSICKEVLRELQLRDDFIWPAEAYALGGRF
jgi:hypothetical protein